MKTFKEFLTETRQDVDAQKALQTIELFEHKQYKRIPGTNNSYREDSANTNTLTLKHSEVYAKQEGKGKVLYAVNCDGTGHDGSSGKAIPAKHADYFRGLGYAIKADNILEVLNINELVSPDHELLLESGQPGYTLIILED